MFEPISKYGNYFVGVDGEGFEDANAEHAGYGLLDSSLDDYPRLYTGTRLTTEQCLDWLWQLGKEAGYCTFVMFGARYDYDNWLRSALTFEEVVRYVASKPLRIGPYLVLHQERFKFELRKIRDEDTSKPEYDAKRYAYDRIHTRLGNSRQDYKGLTFWDVAPFWQTTFVKALDMTLKKDQIVDRELIEEGKEARGTFTHANVEWVSKYNKAECHNLAWMMVELDSWFQQVGIKPLHYNGPGAAAKAMLRAHQPYRHAGRHISAKTHYVSQQVQEYIFPGADGAREMVYRALCADAGGLNRQLKIGFWPGEAYQYDIISAYPFAMLQLPCLSHGEWKRTRVFNRKAFGLWKIRYKATKRMALYPFFWRTPDGNIEYPFAFEERWVHTAELAAGMAIDGKGVDILDGWEWTPGTCDNPWPMWWMAKYFAQRQMHKANGNEGASNGLKLPINSAYGSVAQARGGTRIRPPWTQQLLWAGAITAYTRARLMLAYHTNPDAIVHMATDGIISLEPLPLKLGKGFGEWEQTNLEQLSCIQYGVYAAIEWKEVDGQRWGIPRHRERGFRLKDDEVQPFIDGVHAMWETGHWQSLTVDQRLFVSSKLVAQSEARFDEWCTWKDVTRQIELDEDSVFKRGYVKSMPGMFPISDASYNLGVLGKSSAYEPKWGKGENFPEEWRKADAIQEALDIVA